MKYSELKQKSDDELNQLLETNKKELMNLRFQKQLAELSDTSRIKKIKKDVARIMTLFNNRKGDNNA
jgi:large subunit ribosomal protein L29